MTIKSHVNDKKLKKKKLYQYIQVSQTCMNFILSFWFFLANQNIIF